MKESKFEKIEIKKEKSGEEEQKELTPEEINEMMNEKALDAYRNNVVFRFTNEAFLNDVFVTKKEFLGEGVFICDNDDFKEAKEKDFNERFKKNLAGDVDTKQIYRFIPRGRAGLGTLTDIGFHNADSISKMKWWRDYAEQETDYGNVGGIAGHEYIENLEKTIQSIVQKRKNKEKDSINVKNLRENLHEKVDFFRKNERDVSDLEKGYTLFRKFNISLLVDFDAIKSRSFYHERWVKFKNPEEIDLQKHLKGIISLIRDRVYEKKLIEEMEKLTENNPELRVPIFDLDGNQIYPIRRKREEIEEEIKEENKS